MLVPQLSAFLPRPEQWVQHGSLHTLQILSSLHLYHWKKLDQGTAWSWRESSSLCSLSCRNCSSITACKRKNQKGWQMEWCISSARPRSLFCCFSFYITTHTSSISFVPSHLWVAESHQSAAKTKHCKAKMNARSTAESKKQENVKTLKTLKTLKTSDITKSERATSFAASEVCTGRTVFAEAASHVAIWKATAFCPCDQIKCVKFNRRIRWFEMVWDGLSGRMNTCCRSTKVLREL